MGGPSGAANRPRVVVGGVSELWQGDLDLGRVAVEQLATERVPPGVAVEDLSYGALHVSDMLARLAPEAFVVIGAIARPGRAPGMVERRVIEPWEVDREHARNAVESALTGHINIDLVFDVAAAFETLPSETIAVEVEPQTREPSYELSACCAEALERALGLLRAELARLVPASASG